MIDENHIYARYFGKDLNECKDQIKKRKKKKGNNKKN